MNRISILTNGARAIIRDADNETAAALVRAIVARYEGEEPDIPPALALAWKCIVAELEDCEARQESISAARSEAGRRGNEVRWGGNNRKASQISQTSQSIASIANVANVAEKKERKKEIEIEEKEKEKTIKENEKEPPLSAAITLPGDVNGSGILNNSNADTSTTQRAKPRPRPAPSTADPDFARFWDAYPRRVGKGDAARAYDKARHTPEWPGIDRVIAAIHTAQSSEQWRKDGGQYIPHPATWLNQMRWLDGDIPDADLAAPKVWGM